MSERSLQQLFEERRRLVEEVERIKKRLATLSAEIDAHLPPQGQQQQQPQPPKKRD